MVVLQQIDWGILLPIITFVLGLSYSFNVEFARKIRRSIERGKFREDKVPKELIIERLVSADIFANAALKILSGEGKLSKEEREELVKIPE